VCLLLLCSGTAFAQWESIRRDGRQRGSLYGPVGAERPWQCATGSDHGVGTIRLPVQGYGVLGWAAGGTCWPAGDNQYGVEFPIYSGSTYGMSEIWLGGVRGDDTLVSTGINWTSSVGYPEFRPALPDPLGCVTVETTLPDLTRGWCGTLQPSDSAISYEDIVVRYNDTTLYYQNYTDPVDGRRHAPLGLDITQSSFAWSTGFTENFVIVEFVIRNVGTPGAVRRDTIRDLWFGVSTEGWSINSRSEDNSWDDFVGLVRTAPSPQMPEVTSDFSLAWVADNDGDPSGSGFDVRSATSIVGCALLHVSQANTQMGFNWWTHYWTDEDQWGPVGLQSAVRFPNADLGYPRGDVAKYQVMSNLEIDYPQWEAAIDHSASHWLPPPANQAFAKDIANGFGIEYLLSVGPMNLAPDSLVTVALAVIGGEHFHTSPSNLSTLDPMNPDIYKSGLDYSDLLRNAQWAKWVYDTPGRDTDDDGYSGRYVVKGSDTVYYAGDGVKDLAVGLPPNPPQPRVETRAKRMTMRWNGRSTETRLGLFSKTMTFEGYRIYMSRTGRTDDWALLTQRDVFNYARHTWHSGRQRWEVNDRPFTLDSLKHLYDVLSDSSYGFPFHPDSFSVPLLERALLEVRIDSLRPDRVDSLYRTFSPYEANQTPDDRALAAAQAAGLDVLGVIRKLYPDAIPGDTMYREDATPFEPYYEYEYVMDGLSVAEPVFFSLTAFDHGDAEIGLLPLESSVNTGATELWPIHSAAVVNDERPAPGVYPNPYRQADGYYENAWENRRGLEPDRERARQVTFYNVPETCVVSIYTLDGDLVRRLQHAEAPTNSEATVVRWDLITRNTQAVKTGIYIWSVESRFGTDVGKLVIIK